MNEPQEQPYNPSNVCFKLEDIVNLLSTYSVSKTPVNVSVYKQSMVHKSYCTRKNENAINGNTDCPAGCIPLQEESNERLEFLGDSILNMVVASYLFERFPDENEGFLTRMRTKLVNGKMLAHLSKNVGLDKFVLISKQIEDNDGRTNSNILEDVFEAFIAAIYSDLGIEEAHNWIVSVIEYYLDFADLIIQNNNFKDQFFKTFQQVNGYLPKFYEMNVSTNAKTGQKTFTVCIKDANGTVLSIGQGSNKKEAENNAARQASVLLILTVLSRVEQYSPKLFPCAEDDGTCQMDATKSLSSSAASYLPVLSSVAVREENAPGNECYYMQGCILNNSLKDTLNIRNCSDVPGAMSTSTLPENIRNKVTPGCYIDLSRSNAVDTLESALNKIQQYDQAKADSVLKTLQTKVQQQNTTSAKNSSTINNNTSTIQNKTNIMNNWVSESNYAGSLKSSLAAELASTSTATSLVKSAAATNLQVADSVYRNASFRIGYTPTGVPIIQKYMSNGYYTLLFKYSMNQAANSGWSYSDDPYNLWVGNTNINRDLYAVDPFFYISKHTSHYRNRELMNEVFQSKGAYNIYIEVYNSQLNNKLIGTMKFDKNEQNSMTDWFVQQNYVNTPGSPVLQQSHSWFSISGDGYRRWFINHKYYGCIDPSSMAIPYYPGCDWDRKFRGRIIMPQKVINMSGANTSDGLVGVSDDEMKQMHSGDYMLVYAMRKSMDPYQTDSVLRPPN